MIRVIASLENSLVDSSHKGGLGCLIRDLFLEWREFNDDKKIFLSPLYSKIEKQKYEYNEIVTKVEEFKIEENLKLVDEFKIQIKDEQINVKVYEHNLSTENTKAYFLNSECFNHPVYGEGNAKKEIKTRYCFALATKEFLTKNNLTPNILHLNESDTAFLALFFPFSNIYFHSHTPEIWGHKSYRINDLLDILSEDEIRKLEIARVGDMINLGKYLAEISKGIICVSKQHYEITKEKIYPEFAFKTNYITNGISKEWIGEEWKRLYDKEIPGWKHDVRSLEKIKEISNEKIIKTKEKQIKAFEEYIGNKIERREALGNFDPKKPSYIYAKRLTEYKRPEYTLSLLDLGINLVVSGFPIDETGRRMTEEIKKLSKTGYLIVYVLNYNLETAENLLKGYVWLNIPYSEREASGTSFMKALMNGTIPITTSAGSVSEFVKDGYNGFIVDNNLKNLKDKARLALEIYGDNDRWAEMIKNCLSTYSVLTNRVIEEFRRLK
ncbi:MAG: glycosyltransferase [Candidatus Aenigmarchaeota archaeon]|jgi:starch phosphorylase|nr:glycosyltransferase [Candidatus Aenigmarchaeota archaeon]